MSVDQHAWVRFPDGTYMVAGFHPGNDTIHPTLFGSFEEWEEAGPWSGEPDGLSFIERVQVWVPSRNIRWSAVASPNRLMVPAPGSADATLVQVGAPDWADTDMPAQLLADLAVAWADTDGNTRRLNDVTVELERVCEEADRLGHELARAETVIGVLADWAAVAAAAISTGELDGSGARTPVAATALLAWLLDNDPLDPTVEAPDV